MGAAVGRFRRLRFVVAVVTLVLGFLFLEARLFQHQVLDHSRYVGAATAMHHSRERIPGRRGDIELSDGVIVARDVMGFELGIDPRFIRKENLPDGVRIVCDATGKSPEYRRDRLLAALRAKDSRSVEYVRVASRVSAPEVDAIREALERFLSKSELRCLVARKRSWRVYPRGTFLASVIGVTNEGGDGIEGLEKSLNSYMKPRDGVREFLSDASARRNKYFQLDGFYLPPAATYTVRLTIDSQVQAIAEEALAAGVIEDRAEAGLIVVMDCRDGDILAMASYPTYDPNRFRDYPRSERERRRKNAVIEKLYQPGSVMKPFIFSRALQSGVARRESPMRSLIPEGVTWEEGDDKARFGSRLVTDDKAIDDMVVEDALIYSSNIGMSILGLHLGRDRLIDAIEEFGLCRATGIDLPAEAKGKYTDRSQWKTMYSSVSVSFGYELLVSPLQLCRAFAAVVNGGYLLRPRIVERLSAGEEVYEFPEREVVGRPLTAEYSAEMRAVLREVVQRGTGRFLKLDGFEFGGKTGTARMLVDKGYNREDYLASFEAFAPYEDPEVVILCMVERPRSRRLYGSWVAGPIVTDVIRRMFNVSAVPIVERYKKRS